MVIPGFQGFEIVGAVLYAVVRGVIEMIDECQGGNRLHMPVEKQSVVETLMTPVKIIFEQLRLLSEGGV